jgi:serine/threonine protein kinase
MALSKGTVLATYEILASLGAGGMGEVYRARDSKLGREVAIKILPESFAQDPERLLRFEREAHLLAALNHPNIAAIYDLAESNSTRLLVLELVPGETLAETIRRGPVPVDEALLICRQIADALEVAHDKGIIHRDLKPANIKITPDGKVKVLDFGLGKLTERDDVSAGLSQSPTLLTGRGTVEGVILGTATYMSPEQARGKDVDRRSDIWSFGCVAFELLTGKQAFEGETVTDLFASIIKGEPDWNALPASTPEKVRLVLERCLQKDPRRRLQHIGEARIAMEDAGAAVSLAPTPVAAPTPAWRRSKFWIAAVAVLSSIVIGIPVAMSLLNRSTEEPRVVQFLVPPPEKGGFEQGLGAAVPFSVASISPDGRRLAFTARDTSGKTLLWVRSLDTLTPQSFPGTEGSSFPFWSADSRAIAFFTPTELKRVDVSGGPPQFICSAASARGGTWNRDNVILFSRANNVALSRVSAAGGEPVEVTKLANGQITHRGPWFLPDGRHFLYFAGGSENVSGVFLSSLDSSESRRLMTADTRAIYSPSGDLLFVRQGTLLRQSFNVNTLELRGEAVPVAQRISVNNNLGAFSVSDNGVLAYRSGAGEVDVTLAWVDRSGKVVETLGTPAPYRGVDLSDDGKRIAVHRHDGNGGDIWLLESSRGPISKQTYDPSQENSSPVWAPDNSTIAFAALQSGKWRIYRKAVNAATSAELLAEFDQNTAPMDWSPDGKFIVLRVVTSQADESLLSVSDKKIIPLLHNPFNELRAQISSDGKWIAYDSNESGQSEIYVRPFPSGEDQRQVSVNGGYAPRWRADGKELFYLTRGGAKMASVKINTTGSALSFDPPVELFDTGSSNLTHSGGTFLPYAVSPDGQRFLIPRSEANSPGDAATAPITVIFNWTATLKP